MYIVYIQCWITVPVDVSPPFEIRERSQNSRIKKLFDCQESLWMWWDASHHGREAVGLMEFMREVEP